MGCNCNDTVEKAIELAERMAKFEKVPYIVYKTNGGYNFIKESFAHGRTVIKRINV